MKVEAKDGDRTNENQRVKYFGLAIAGNPNSASWGM